MAYRNEIGSKYEQTKTMSTADIAKLIRADLKAAFPGVKFGVRSASRSIDITVKTLPAGMTVRAPEGSPTWMTEQAIAFTRAISAVANEYNFDRSELESDYFHVRFYENVTFSSELTARPVAPVLALVKAPSEADEVEARWTALLAR